MHGGHERPRPTAVLSQALQAIGITCAGWLRAPLGHPALAPRAERLVYTDNCLLFLT